MFSIGPSLPGPDSELLDAPGGMAWWYVDLVDEDGNGAVCIWSWGLPFLPGVAAASRAGRPALPRHRPAWNLAVYRGGEQVFYLLEEPARERSTWQPDAWTLGGFAARQEISGDRVCLDITVDTTLAREHTPVCAHLQLEGPLCRVPGCSRQPEHSWEPVTLGGALGRLDVSCGAWSTSVEGRAYHDRNVGRSALCDLGMRAWRWGRFALPGGDLVFYDVSGESSQRLLVWVDAAGTLDRRPLAEIVEQGHGAARFGPRWPRNLDLDDHARVRLDHLVDDGPFYQRWLGTAEVDGQRGRGVIERVAVDRLDPPLLRPLVRMRVQREAGGNSLWLPLFNGPGADRLRRLGASWLGLS